MHRRGERIRPWGLAALAVAALALILALVAPAIGGKSGPSTKKLAKEIKALQAEDVALRAQVANLQLAQGPPGPQGPQGAQGPRGPAGPGAVKVDFDHANTDIGSDSSFRTVATAGDLKVRAYCSGNGINTYLVYGLNSAVAAGVNGTVIKSSNGGTPSASSFGELMSPGQDLHLDGTPAAISGGYERDEFSGVYRSDTHVMQIELLAIANDGSHRCQLTGAITPTG